jgi:hypothetical protein
VEEGRRDAARGATEEIAVAIDPATGAIELHGLRFEPSLTRRAFLESSASSRFEAHDMRTGFVNYGFRDAAAGGMSFAGWVAFKGERLEGYTLAFTDAELERSHPGGSRDIEQRRRAAHDAWLESFLGAPSQVDEPHYSKEHRFAWGTVGSSYDPRSDSSCIVVSF